MLLDAKDSLLLVVDPQGSLMHKVFDTDRIVGVIKKLVSIARELTVPILITEHYPEGLQPSIPEIKAHLGEDYKPITKIIFSCYGSKELRGAVEDSGRKTLVLVGIETHICVLQTALQFKEAGYRVVVVQDGVSCRSKADHEAAIRRMERSGVETVTWEMAAYEWMRRADTPEFKRVLPYIKEGA
jgi:nicotinamidase-related amidase